MTWHEELMNILGNTRMSAAELTERVSGFHNTLTPPYVRNLVYRHMKIAEKYGLVRSFPGDSEQHKMWERTRR